MNKRAHNIIQDGIVYAFQYGIITEKEHFKLLDKLNNKYEREYEQSRRRN